MFGLCQTAMGLIFHLDISAQFYLMTYAISIAVNWTIGLGLFASCMDMPYADNLFIFSLKLNTYIIDSAFSAAAQLDNFPCLIKDF